MAIQFTDYSRAPLIDSPWNNIFQKVMQGYQMGRIPAQLKQEEQAKNLSNQMSQLKLEQAPQEFQGMQKQRELANQLAALKLQYAPQEFQTSQTGANLMNALRQSQLKYAEPEAQARLGLLGSQQQSAAANAQRMLAQLEQEKAFRDMFAQATGGGGAQAQGILAGAQAGQIPPSQAGDLQGQGQGQGAPGNMVVASPGNTGMYGVDQLYDQNPLSRALLEKQGFKKTQSIQRDPSTGATNVITTFPSGKVTIQESPKVESEFSPPTRSVITQNQNILRGVDNVLPVIEEIKKMPIPGSITGKFMSPNDKANYDSATGGIIESMLSIYNLPSTDKAVAKIEKMIMIQPFESEKNYLKRLDKLEEELKSRQKVSVNQLSKGNRLIGSEEKASQAESQSQEKPAGKFNFGQYSVYGGGQ